MRRRTTGLSLLEMLAVVVIMGMVATMVVPMLASGVEQAKEKICFHHRAQINAASERYYIVNDVYPSDDLSELENDEEYFPSGIPTCPISGAEYMLNSSTKRVLGHTGGGKGGVDHDP